METPPSELYRLEVELMKIMIALVVRDPDGYYRIQRALHAVEEAGADLTEQQEELH